VGCWQEVACFAEVAGRKGWKTVGGMFVLTWLMKGVWLVMSTDEALKGRHEKQSGYSTFIHLLCMLASLAPPAKKQRVVCMYVLNTYNSVETEAQMISIQ
jgi:hypothetical protein